MQKPEELVWTGSKAQSAEGIATDALVQIALAITKLSNDVAAIRHHVANQGAAGEK